MSTHGRAVAGDGWKDGQAAVGRRTTEGTAAEERALGTLNPN